MRKPSTGSLVNKVNFGLDRNAGKISKPSSEVARLANAITEHHCFLKNTLVLPSTPHPISIFPLGDTWSYHGKSLDESSDFGIRTFKNRT